MKIISLILMQAFSIFETKQIGPADLVFIVISQSNTYYANLAEDLKQDIIKQSKVLDNKNNPDVYLTHIDFLYAGDWTIIPVIPKIVELYANTTKWIIFCQEITRFYLENLLDTLEKYDSHKIIMKDENDNNCKMNTVGVSVFGKWLDIISEFKVAKQIK